MTGFAGRLEDAAEDAVRHTSPPKIKIGPDPPSSGVAHAAPAHVLDLPVSVRPHVDHRALEQALERAAARVDTGDSARLVALVEKKLAGRAVDALTTAERGALVESLRQELVRLCPGVEKRQKQFREQLRIASRIDIGSDVRRSTVTASGGTWVFWHSSSPISPVILGEGFVPTHRGNPIPTVRPAPMAAGISGQPRWRRRDGVIVDAPPPLPAQPTLATTGLSQEALEKAPDLVLEEFARARKSALAVAERELRPLPFKTSGVHRRTGTRITSIESYAPAVPGGEWNELTVITGVVGPDTTRLPDSALDEVLAPARHLPPELAGYARMHAWGPIFGDETLSGLAYGPHEAVNLFQKDTVEAFAFWGSKRSARLNVKAGMPLKVSQYVQYRDAGGVRLPFVRTVRYDFSLEDGRIISAVLDVTPDGKVTTSILPESILP